LKKRIRNSKMISPAYEDGGLFKKPPTELVVNLVPKFGKNSRQDVIVKALVQNGVEIDVIFAGRRKKHAEDVVLLLQRMWEDAVFSYRMRPEPPLRTQVRLPARLYGSWRTRVFEDDEEWIAREYQFLVALWAYKSDTGEMLSFGELPVTEQGAVKAASKV